MVPGNRELASRRLCTAVKRIGRSGFLLAFIGSYLSKEVCE